MPTPTKTPGGVRQRAPSSLSKVSTPPNTSTSKASKASLPTLIVRLKLASKDLSEFSSASPTPEASETKSSPTRTTKPPPKKAAAAGIPIQPDSSASPSTKDQDESHSSDGRLKEEDTKVTAGVKRELGAGVTPDDKAKPKPVQRKRPKVGENGRIDGRTAAAKAMGYNAAAHKLGPKANQGVINEKLRALDRTNKPCRKWQKTGFKIRSFTGRAWEVPTWRTPQEREFGEGVDSRETSTSEPRKEPASSSNVGSDKSPAGENPIIATSPIRMEPTPE